MIARLISFSVALWALGCLQAVKPSETERVYVVAHSEASQVDAFDKVEEWVAVRWVSAQDVVQVKNERTGTMIVKWLTMVTFGRPIAVRSTAIVRVTEEDVTFTMQASAGPEAQALAGVLLGGVYDEWDAMMSNTPWGQASMAKGGYSLPQR